MAAGSYKLDHTFLRGFGWLPSVSHFALVHGGGIGQLCRSYGEDL